jgi:hypothetical protein
MGFAGEANAGVIFGKSFWNAGLGAGIELFEVADEFIGGHAGVWVRGVGKRVGRNIRESVRIWSGIGDGGW